MFLFRSLLAICLTGSAFAAESLEATFARMDSVSAQFKGLTANLKQMKHMILLKEDETYAGRVVVKRPAKKDLRMLMVFEPPNERKAYFGGSKAQIYYPNANLVQEWDLGKTATLRDELMMLAFGSNSRDIQSAYSVKLGGADTVGGQKATRIVLTPKNPELSKMFHLIDMWIADETGLTLQQKLHESGGDYVMATYSDIKLTNPPDSAVKLDVPKNAKIERPQK